MDYGKIRGYCADKQLKCVFCSYLVMINEFWYRPSDSIHMMRIPSFFAPVTTAASVGKPRVCPEYSVNKPFEGTPTFGDRGQVRALNRKLSRMHLGCGRKPK